ncbi:MAG: peptide chain release factor N(5)-glutamine methyltransferase, partial [Acidobacteria bacterium]|nr:peptide chain release factor N(5)-glutamine methyltransferase [Acidobacteriota bacterium]
ALETAAEKLHNAGVAEPRREAMSLLAFALGQDKTFLIAHPKNEITPDELSRYDKFLRRRQTREPLQYITGIQEFYRLEFAVTPNVLIPRPETEMVVEAAAELLAGKINPKICEVGIGSGCISISILNEIESARGLGVDISQAALKVAAFNAAKHQVDDRLRLIESNVFSAVGENKFDLIAANPPYVPQADVRGLQEEVRDYEPHVALTDSRDGLSIIRRIAAEAPQYLKPRGWLLMEIGFNQGSNVRKMFDREIWKDFSLLPDLQGIPRLVKARV